jgi:hypothetical protein
VTVGGILTDAWRVYVLLFRRSIVVALVTYVLIALLDAAGGRVMSIVSFVAGLAGPMLVQGALVEIVRNIHEGRRPAGSVELVKRAGRRIVALVAASLFYVVGVIVGLVLLIIPGLYIAGRWSLVEPAIMLEDKSLLDAFNRSARIVRGEDHPEIGDRTTTAFGVVILTYIVTSIPALVLGIVFGWGDSSLPEVVAATAVSALIAPYAAHVLSVLYYRLVDPDAPTIHPDVQSWRSVWEGPA